MPPAQRRPSRPERINARQFHLTYAALYPGELTHAKLIHTMTAVGAELGGLLEYSCGREEHDEPADPERYEHFHFYAHYREPKDVADRFRTKVFDTRGRAGRVLHPEVQAIGPTAGDRRRVIEYTMKDGDWKQELAKPLGSGNGKDGEKGPPAWATMLNAAKTVQAGMRVLQQDHPDIYYLSGARVEPMLAKRLGAQQPKIFTLDDFNRPRLDLDVPVVLHGVTNAGKTEYALAHFDRPALIRRRDDLKLVTATTDGLVFDDMTFTGWEPEEIISLLDITKTRTIGARFADAQLQADTPMIFTTNLDMGPGGLSIFPPGRTNDQQGAIKRRYVAVAITGPLQKMGRAFTREEMRARREQDRAPQGQAGPSQAGTGSEHDASEESDGARRPPPAQQRRHAARRIVESSSDDDDEPTQPNGS